MLPLYTKKTETATYNKSKNSLWSRGSHLSLVRGKERVSEMRERERFLKLLALKKNMVRRVGQCSSHLMRGVCVRTQLRGRWRRVDQSRMSHFFKSAGSFSSKMKWMHDDICDSQGMNSPFLYFHQQIKVLCSKPVIYLKPLVELVQTVLFFSKMYVHSTCFCH